MSSTDKEPEEDGRSEDDEDKDPIKLMADDCVYLLDTSLTHTAASGRSLPPIALSFLEEYKRRFQGWCSYMCVITEHEQASLDYRLRNHPSLQDMVMRLLDVLRNNLLLIANYRSLEIEPNSYTSETDLPYDIQVGFKGIKESVARLNKLGIAIRTSSRSTLVARARRFAAQYPNLVPLSDFEDRAYMALQYLYPSAPESLRQQLSDSMTDRYAKLRYETFRTRGGELQSSSKARSLEEKSGERDAPAAEKTVGTSVGAVKAPQIESRSQGLVPIMPASSVYTAAVQENVVKEGTNSVAPSKAPRTLAGQSGKLREPQLPHFAWGEEPTKCEWCPRFNERSWVRFSPTHNYPVQWTAEGQRHYRQDLEPYVCLAEACRETRPSFALSNKWFNHMKFNHSEAWSSMIHSQALWTCKATTEMGDSVHENDIIYTFSTEKQLMSHWKLQHPGMLPNCDASDNDDDKKDVYKAEFICSKSTRSVFSCPLCSFTEEHNNERERDGEEVITSDAMGSHIADHLHHLMMVTLQIIKAMEPVSNDVPDFASGPSTGLSGPCSEMDENAIQAKRDERLEELILELKDSYQEQLTALQALYPRWSDKDLLWIIDDANGDVEASTTRILEIESDRKEADTDTHSGREDLSMHILSMHDQYVNDNRTFSQISTESSNFSVDQEGVEKDTDLSDLLSREEVRNYESKPFIPIGVLDRILTETMVCKALDVESSESSGRLADFVLSRARRCFAIISDLFHGAGAKRLRSIMSAFMEHGFMDSNLPVQDLRRDAPEDNILWMMTHPGRPESRIFKLRDIELFCIRQWKFLAPVFSPDSMGQELSENAILPFTQRQYLENRLFDRVSKCRIHPDHFVGFQIFKNNAPTSVAVKDSYYETQSSNHLAKHLKALAELGTLNHKHIARLFTNFTIRKHELRYFIILEYADDGNLRDLWQTYPHSNLIGSRVKFIEQLHGLAEALSVAHSINVRHENLKPSNVLWFRDGGEFGTLKLCDWGESADGKITNLRYRAPEFETGIPRSRITDLWAFGCLMLEAVIWLVYDWENLDRFNAQLGLSPCYRTELEGAEKAVFLHDIPKNWMTFMAGLPTCQVGKSALGDLLDIIQNGLLVTQLPGQSSEQLPLSSHSFRLNAVQLTERLQNILDLCTDENETYWQVYENPHPPRLSELKGLNVPPPPTMEIVENENDETEIGGKRETRGRVDQYPIIEETEQQNNENHFVSTTNHGSEGDSEDEPLSSNVAEDTEPSIRDDEIPNSSFDMLISEGPPPSVNPWFQSVTAFSKLVQTATATGIPPVKIAIIGDGVDPEYGCIKGHIVQGVSFKKARGPNSESDIMHPWFLSTPGYDTHAADIICRICPGVQLYIARLDERIAESGKVFTAHSAAKAIKWAVSCEVAIISMGWAIEPHVSRDDMGAIGFLSFWQATTRAYQREIVMFCKDPTVRQTNPIPRYRECITIGSDLYTSGFFDFWLPASHIPSGNLSSHLSGDSIATAAASGLAGLLIFCALLVNANDRQNSNFLSVRRTKQAFKQLSRRDKFLDVQKWIKEEFQYNLAGIRAITGAKKGLLGHTSEEHGVKDIKIDNMAWDDDCTTALHIALRRLSSYN